MTARALLSPLIPLYRLGLARRERWLATGAEPVRRLDWPVISVGNLSAGGAGKTPLTIALAGALRSRGFHVDVLSRGYGRTREGAARVPANGTAEEFGDEPLLIARQAHVPVYVARQRYEAGRLAEADATPGIRGVHLLDDGFQHRQLHRDVDIVLLSGADLRDRLLPAGNLREPLEAMRRADLVAIPDGDTQVAEWLDGERWSGPVWRLRRRMEVPQVEGPVLAFCGIARPEQFFAGLRLAGIDVAGTKAFRDHYDYTQEVLDWLGGAAGRCGASTLVTTEKDAVRLEGLRPSLPVLTVGLRTEIKDESAALDWLGARLAGAEMGAH